ncbi:hypothetical protein C8R45DRAFT_924099 [Mycena sanguinolenta]|nr:hypothetical protein C8R45DRAFT_924099 [Mycena sanguinolenta]
MCGGQRPGHPRVKRRRFWPQLHFLTCPPFNPRVPLPQDVIYQMSTNLDQRSTSFAKFSAPIQVASVWEIQSSGKAVCLICKDGRERAAKNCAAHENTPAHQSLLAHRQNQDISEPALVDDGMRNLLSSLSGGSVDPYPAPHAPDPNLGIAWNLMTDDTDIPLSAAEQGIANIASAILHRYDEVPASDDEFEERSDDENYSVPEPVVPEFPSGTGRDAFPLFI